MREPTASVAPIDRSVDGSWVEPNLAGEIHLIDPIGGRIKVELPHAWTGPTGTVALARPWTQPSQSRTVRGLASCAALGGMGAGFAASLGGTLISALGPETDPTSEAVVALLDQAGIAHEAVRIADQTADSTLLITSGEHGDKLAVGFRGCHAAWTDLGRRRDQPARIRVVAALPNRLAARALGDSVSGTIRVFFPSSRNMLDRADPLVSFVDRIDLMSFNQGEWYDLGDGVAALDRVAIVAVTDGPRGASVRFRSIHGGLDRVEVPAFPRSSPIVDTNRAGEAFASTLLRTLVDSCWAPGPTSPDLIRFAAVRASAASALVLGRSDFGFASVAEIDDAVRRGVV